MIHCLKGGDTCAVVGMILDINDVTHLQKALGGPVQ